MWLFQVRSKFKSNVTQNLNQPSAPEAEESKHDIAYQQLPEITVLFGFAFFPGSWPV